MNPGTVQCALFLICRPVSGLEGTLTREADVT